MRKYADDMKQFDNKKRRDYRHVIVVARSWTKTLGDFVRDNTMKPVFIFADRLVAELSCGLCI